MYRAVLIAIALGIFTGTVDAQTLRPDSESPVFVEPARRASGAAPDAPPAVPAAVDVLPPATLEIVIVRAPKQGPRRTSRQTITRETGRVHVATGTGEWLFERNRADGRRVSATFIDHEHRALVFHDESDLRNRLGIRGWVDVVAMGEQTSITTPDGTVRVTVARERREVDRGVFAPPAERFPGYRVLDLAEWLEDK
jgi:hypothetical protein